MYTTAKASQDSDPKILHVYFLFISTTQVPKALFLKEINHDFSKYL